MFLAFQSLVLEANGQEHRVGMSGADFLNACSRMDESWISFCHGYVQAVVDGPRVDNNGYCIPSGTTRADLVGHVVRILQTHEGLHGLGAYSVVYAAIASAYPCDPG